MRRRDLEFDIRDFCLIENFSHKEVKWFGKKEKISPYYVGPNRILRQFGKVTYDLDLPVDLSSVHPVFHVSLLKKCIGDPTSVVPLESVGVEDSVSYE